MIFDHEKLDVYKASLEFVAFVAEISNELRGDHRNAKDQLIRASQSIPLNIAEGNGKRSLPDRNRYFEIARGLAMESAAILDVLVRCGARSEEDLAAGKILLKRIVSMLYKMTEVRSSMARESEEEYSARISMMMDDDEHDDELNQS